MEFESITEAKAKKILSSDQGAEVDEGILKALSVFHAQTDHRNLFS